MIDRRKELLINRCILVRVLSYNAFLNMRAATKQATEALKAFAKVTA